MPPPDTSDSDTHISSLPQCGFGTVYEFNSLIKSNQFLFRVYTPKERSPFADDTEPFFVAPRFDELVVRSPADLPVITPWEGTYADVARHMEWTTRSSSPYVSTSFSFAWAIWEAVRRYHTGVKKDVEIAIIDATALDGRAATAIQLLKQSSPEERNEQFWKWYRFSQDSQSVLIYGMVPRTAVLASIPLLQIMRKLPSYFLRKDVRIIDGNPLDQVSWDYTRRKQHYRQFCQQMSKNFMDKSVEVRLRDSTAGAVRLGLSFLQPFIHAVVQDHFEVAVSYLRSLSVAISEWPGGWWVKDHPEVRQIVEVMVLTVTEELRAKYPKKAGETSPMDQVIGELQHTVKMQREPRKFSQEIDLYSDNEIGAEVEESDEPTLVNPLGASYSLPLPGRTPLHVPIVLPPKITISFQSPITPPESPRVSLFVPVVTAPSNVDIAPAQSTTEQASSTLANEEVSQDRVPCFTRPCPVSDELASPPPTPSAGTPVFLHTKLETIVEDDLDPEVDMYHVSPEYEADHRQAASDSTLVTEDTPYHDYAKSIEVCETDVPAIDFPSMTSTHDVIYPEEQERQHNDTNRVVDNGIEETSGFEQPMPLIPWIAVRQLESPFSSRRSSIVSVETLCEPIEFPVTKRLSFTSTSDSFEFVPTMRSMALSSRTVSFSELYPQMLPWTPPHIETVVDPLPHSPSESEHSGQLSRPTSRASSSTSSTVSNDSILPLITPLPPSPVWSIDSLPSSLSRSSSNASSVPQTPVPHSRELSTSESSPTASVASFKRPGPSISLLAPLAYQDADAQPIVRRRHARTGVVSETASYIVTGFLVGAFLTLFLFSTQRKTMLYLT